MNKGDTALAASLAGVAVLAGVFVDGGRPSTVEPSRWWHWLLIVTPSLLVAFRRVNPILATGIATLAQIGIWISDLPEVLLPMIVILYSAASEEGKRGLGVAVGSSVVLTIVTGVGVQIAGDVTAYQLPLIVLTCGTAIALGVNSAQQRDLAGELATEVAETRLRGEHHKTQAVLAERSHIARELHDIIGHTLSVIAVRAEAADRVGSTRPEAAADAVAAIADSARTALTETRRVLAGLRQSAEVELAPPPDLDSIRRLVRELGEAGIDVSLSEHDCEIFEPSPVITGGAYRIVQESLTNAVKHAGPDVSVVVTLRCTRDELEVMIEDNGFGRVRLGRARGDAVTPGGSGLAAMAERAQVLGGEFTAVNNDNGGFVVRALLPRGERAKR